MEFLKLSSSRGSGLAGYRSLENAFGKYFEYVESIKDKMPRGLYEFIVNDWHYDPRHHRSLHDSWLQRLEIREVEIDEGRQRRRIDIHLTLLGAHHDGHTYLEYKGVTRYCTDLRSLSESGNRGHGDLVIDETRLGASDHIIHEILFSSGAELLIECRNMSHATDIPCMRS